MKCPGQDTRYWRPEDVTEVTCSRCGATVEFFKTDGARPCPGCSARISNPKLALGCAQWCAQARECLGFDPASLRIKQAEQSSLVDRLSRAMRREFEGGSTELTAGGSTPLTATARRIGHALAVLDSARAILRIEGGNPRVVLAAALLHDIGYPQAERKYGGAQAAEHHEREGASVARRVMVAVGFDADALEEVCRIIAGHHRGGEADTPEFRIVHDADLLVNLSQGAMPLTEPEVAGRFKTKAGAELARDLLRWRSQGEAAGEKAG